MNQTLLTIIGSVGVVATALAAAFWFLASVLEVPDNIHTFLSALQRVSQINAWAASASGAAAVCAFVIWLSANQGWRFWARWATKQTANLGGTT